MARYVEENNGGNIHAMLTLMHIFRHLHTFPFPPAAATPVFAFTSSFFGATLFSSTLLDATALLCLLSSPFSATFAGFDFTPSFGAAVGFGFMLSLGGTVAAPADTFLGAIMVDAAAGFFSTGEGLASSFFGAKLVAVGLGFATLEAEVGVGMGAGAGVDSGGRFPEG